MEKFIYVNGEFVDRISDEDLNRIEKCFNGKITNTTETTFFGDKALNVYIQRDEK